MKTVLITGIGGLTPRSIATIIRENHADYKIIGCDMKRKAMGFFMKTKNGKNLVDKCYIVPQCDSPDYFSAIKKIVTENSVDYAFVQPESEIVEWSCYYEEHGEFPVPTFMCWKSLAEGLKDKGVMAHLLEGTEFIPKTIKVTHEDPRVDDVKKEIGFPCWIRATEGTGGLGSLRIDDIKSYRSWLLINSGIPEFTVSEFLSGRHLANQMLYYNGEYVKGAALECVEYVMANTAPSHVTGNTHFGRFLNEDRINKFCDDCIRYLEKKLGVSAHGIFSFDLKEDKNGNLKVTEVNIRHMAYTSVMAHVGFDLIEDTIRIHEDGDSRSVVRDQYHHYDKPYIFLRDVDVEPIVLESEEVFESI